MLLSTVCMKLRFKQATFLAKREYMGQHMRLWYSTYRTWQKPPLNSGVETSKIWSLVYSYILVMRTGKVVSLGIQAGSPEPSLLYNVTRTKISCIGSIFFKIKTFFHFWCCTKLVENSKNH